MSLRDQVLDRGTTLFRLLPRGRTVAHRTLWRMLGAPRHFLGRVRGSWFAVDPLDTDISTTIYLRQEWELPASAVWRALLAPGQVVVDVGANKGWFSLLAAQAVTGAGRVVSYEPLPRNVRDLNATATANRWGQMVVRPVGLSNHGGTAGLVSPTEEQGSGWGSFEKPEKEGWRTDSVEITTLDEELDHLDLSRVDLLKMDIEGHELAALQGAQRSLASGRITRLLVEVHVRHLGPERTAEIHRLMEDAGYRGRWLDEAAHSDAEWRRIFAQSRTDDALASLVPISGVEDPRIADRHWYKILWERPKAP